MVNFVTMDTKKESLFIITWLEKFQLNLVYEHEDFLLHILKHRYQIHTLILV